MKIEVDKDKKGEVRGWILCVGDLKFHCRTEKEAECLETVFKLKQNKEIYELVAQQWEEDILTILKKQHRAFLSLLLPLLYQPTPMVPAMVQELLWEAVDLLMRWPAPAPEPDFEFEPEHNNVQPSTPRG